MIDVSYAKRLNPNGIILWVTNLGRRKEKTCAKSRHFALFVKTDLTRVATMNHPPSVAQN